MLESVPCPSCLSQQNEVLYQNKRIAGSLSELPVVVVQCESCGFLFNSPRPDATTLASYYSQDTMASGQVFRDESVDSHYPKLHAERAIFLAKLLQPCRGRSLLDVGCGTGGFLRALTTELRDWELTGLDPSSHAVDSCIKQGLVVHQAAIGDDIFSAQSFDVISLISVLEHLPDPAIALGWCRQRLTEEGLLFVEVPNSLEPELSLTGFFNLEHIVHFTPASLSRMLQQQGFNFVLRDRDASGVIRLAASKDFAVWQVTPDLFPSDDRKQARQSVLNYANAEQNLIDGLCQRVEEALKDWRQRELRIAVYGAGIHTEQLAKLVNLSGSACCVLDSDPKKQGQKYLGLPILAPKKLAEGNIEAVLISSNRFIDEMVRAVLKYGGANVEIRTCYD
jgi:2-polyprenyl-3-methyl-5-hydroxy-6-metoxy-1,4-benzoquinol methylase